MHFQTQQIRYVEEEIANADRDYFQISRSMI